MGKLTPFERRKRRVRRQLHRTSAGRPRLSVHRSSKNIYAQVIDDRSGKTIAAASSLESDLKSQLRTGADCSAAETVGRTVAARALEAGIKDVVFDRGGYRYHGRIKALADGARGAGLQF
ncbi:MAG: 50S ribosomal protein L18 [Hyphomicrobiaceae bacterium]